MNFQKMNITQGVGYKAMRTKTLKRLFILTTLMMLPLVATAQTCPAAPVGDVKDPVFQLVSNASDRFQIGATDSVSSTIRGALVWDDANSTIAVCDGTNWVTLGAGGGVSAINDLSDGYTDDGNYNLGVGSGALGAVTSSVHNAAVGVGALADNSTNGYNTAIGSSALGGNVSGGYNTAVGASAMNGATGSSNVAIGSATLMNIGSGNSNVAVGEYAGNYLADGFTANTGPTSGLYLGSYTKVLAAGGTNEIVIGDSAIGAGSNSVVLGNDSIVTTALKGNVGIGTTSPSSTLHVSGTVIIADGGEACAATTAGAMRYNGGAIEFCNGTAWTALGGGGADNLGNHVATQVLDMGYNAISKTSYISVNDGVNSNFGFITEAGLDGIGLTGNSVRLNDPEFYVSDAGRIGIGTTAPSTILTIENDGSTVVRARGHDNSDIQGAPYYISEKARGTKAAPLAVQSGDNLAAYEMGGYDGSGYTGATASVKALATENFTNSAHGTALRFETTPEGTTTRQTRMYIGADGNVGIGTQAPSRTLHMISNNATVAVVERDSAAHSVIEYKNTAGSLFTGLYSAGDAWGVGTSPNLGNDGIIKVVDTGRVGIGTNTPSSTLHVNSTSGDAIYIASGLVNGADIRMGAAGFLLADASVHVGLDGTNSSTTSKFRIVKDVTTDPGSAPSVFDVSESGAVVASGTVTATGFINSSDKRLKDEIHTVMNPLEIVKKLRGVFYKWKDSGRESAGVIAQEVREVLPSAVHEREDGMLAVEYNQLIAPMIEAIKMQQEQIEALKAEVEELKRAQ